MNEPMGPRDAMNFIVGFTQTYKGQVEKVTSEGGVFILQLSLLAGPLSSIRIETWIRVVLKGDDVEVTAWREMFHDDPQDRLDLVLFGRQVAHLANGITEALRQPLGLPEEWCA